MPRWATVLLAVSVVLLLSGAALAQGNDSATQTTGDPPYRATGQWILYATIAAIGVGLVGTWWVVKRYDP